MAKSAQGSVQPKVVPAARLPAKTDSAAKTAAFAIKQPARIKPMDDTVSRLMAIISEEARVDLAELGPDSEFADYGIDSLMSLTISGRLQEELGLDISSSVFAEYPTVKDLKGLFQAPGIGSSTSALTSGVTTPDSSNDQEDDDTDATSVDGSHDITDVIRLTISEESGIPLEELTPSARLAELGIDSLLTLTIMGRLSEKLGMSLPSTLLSDNETVLDVENTLGMNRQFRTKRTELRTTTEKHNAVVATAEHPQKQTHSAPPATSIRLQGFAKTAKKTLFLFPDGSGSATSYAAIPQISPDVVVYGLNCPWMKTPQDLKCSLEQYTATYLAEIRRRQPKGPYYFGGWSAGGICAYEAAKQLARTGESVTKLLLIDSPNPVGLENPPQRMYDFFESLDFFGMNGKTPPSWLRPHFDAFIQMLDDYKVKPFTGRTPEVHMIYAKDGICKHPSDPRPEIRPDDPREMLWLLNNRTDFSGGGWVDLVGRHNMTIKVLENVNHFSMVAAGPKIAELSAFIAGAME